MEAGRSLIPGDGCQVPALIIHPGAPRGAAIILHGYGGNKEEQLGLGWRVAEAGLLACTIDLRGHGEHLSPLDCHIGSDVEAAIRYCRSYGKVTVIGHSLGGRLALISEADFHIAISPSLSRTYGAQTQAMLRSLRSYRVRPSDLSVLLEIQDRLPVWDAECDTGNALVLYAERDAPEIIEECTQLRDKGAKTIGIPGTMHNDIFLAGQTFAIVRDHISGWYRAGT